VLTAAITARARGCIAALFLTTTRLPRRPLGSASEHIGHGKELVAEKATAVRANRLGTAGTNQDLNPLVTNTTTILVDRHIASF
jgi:hypothetical protein